MSELELSTMLVLWFAIKTPKVRLSRKITCWLQVRKLGMGTKIKFLSDQGKTIRNEYLCCKGLKTAFGFVCSRDKKFKTCFEVLAQ